MISGPSSYPATIREFAAHWAQVNTFLGQSPLTLQGGATVAILNTLGDDLDTTRDAVTDAAIERTLARESLTDLVTRLQARAVEFSARVRADFAGTYWVRSLPELFSPGDAENRVRETLRAISALWSKINGIQMAPAGVTLPLDLLGGYSWAVLQNDRDALRAAYAALTTAEVELKTSRERRNDLQDQAYEILKAYRMRVPTAVPAGNALVDSLPRLTPEGGHTPEAVTATGSWDAQQQKAKITWPASTEAALDYYEVRGVPGDDYTLDDESVLANIDGGSPLEFYTDFALGQQGAKAGFKVYVVLNTGNEKGSNTVYVTRP